MRIRPAWLPEARCAQDEDSNPIKQDIKKGKLRFYPYNINWNYGLLPQTWEDPTITHPDLGAAVCPQSQKSKSRPASSLPHPRS